MLAVLLPMVLGATAPAPLVPVLAGPFDGQVRLTVPVAADAGPITVTVAGAPQPTEVHPVLGGRLDLALVLDASADGRAALPAGVSGAADLLLATPSAARSTLIVDSDPPSVAVPLRPGPADPLRALSAVPAGGARQTAAALDLAVGQLPVDPTRPRVVLLYTGAADAGGTPAAELTARLNAAGVMLAVVAAGPPALDYWSAVSAGTGGVAVGAAPPQVVAAFDRMTDELRGRALLTFPTPPDRPATAVVRMDGPGGPRTGSVLVPAGFAAATPANPNPPDRGVGAPLVLALVAGLLVLGAAGGLAMVRWRARRLGSGGSAEPIGGTSAAIEESAGPARSGSASRGMAERRVSAGGAASSGPAEGPLPAGPAAPGDSVERPDLAGSSSSVSPAEGSLSAVPPDSGEPPDRPVPAGPAASGAPAEGSVSAGPAASGDPAERPVPAGQPASVTPADRPVPAAPPAPAGPGRSRPAAEAANRAAASTPPRADRSVPAGSAWNLPDPHPAPVVREQLLAEMRAAAHRGDRVVLHAEGDQVGVGASTALIEFAHRYRADYDIAWWIPAADPELIPDRMAELAETLGLVEKTVPAPDATARLLDVLAHRDRWLIVFDAAQGPHELSDVLPDGPGHVLLTSADPSWPAPVARLAVPVFTRSEAVGLFRARRRRLPIDAAALAATAVQGLPLAVDPVGGLLAESGLGAEDLLRGLAARPPTLGPGAQAGSEAFLATWTLALDQLAVADPGASALLTLVGWLGAEPVPLALLTEHPEVLPEPLTRIARRLVELAGHAGTLRRRGLARVDYRGVQVHPRIAELLVARTAGERAGGGVDWAITAVRLLRAGLPDEPDDPAATWPGWRQLLPMVLIATDPARSLEPAAVDVAWLLGRGRRLPTGAGSPERGRPLFSDASRSVPPAPRRGPPGHRRRGRRLAGDPPGP